jgi:hypothetical protein
MTYHCPAARNFAMGRWECPIPISPACNANCVGCISLQPDEEAIVSTQDRLNFKPTPEEIVDGWFTELCRNVGMDGMADGSFIAEAGRMATNNKTRSQA